MAPKEEANQDEQNKASKDTTEANQWALKNRTYSKSFERVLWTTELRFSDFDAKAVQLLDALYEAGAINDVCRYLVKHMGYIRRSNVRNIHGYVFQLLRKYDVQFYEDFRERRGLPNRRLKLFARPAFKELTVKTENASIVVFASKFKFNPQAPEFKPRGEAAFYQKWLPFYYQQSCAEAMFVQWYQMTWQQMRTWDHVAYASAQPSAQCMAAASTACTPCYTRVHCCGQYGDQQCYSGMAHTASWTSQQQCSIESRAESSGVDHSEWVDASLDIDFLFKSMTSAKPCAREAEASSSAAEAPTMTCSLASGSGDGIGADFVDLGEEDIDFESVSTTSAVYVIEEQKQPQTTKDMHDQQSNPAASATCEDFESDFVQVDADMDDQWLIV